MSNCARFASIVSTGALAQSRRALLKALVSYQSKGAQPMKEKRYSVMRLD
jgi:hypothetical protein